MKNILRNKNMKKEIIICSAIWYKELKSCDENLPLQHYLPKNLSYGIVFCGFRHGHCLYTRYALDGTSDSKVGDSVQGFLTNLNNFVDRIEGAKIHVENGGTLSFGKLLYSEDLY